MGNNVDSMKCFSCSKDSVNNEADLKFVKGDKDEIKSSSRS